MYSSNVIQSMVIFDFLLLLVLLLVLSLIPCSLSDRIFCSYSFLHLFFLPFFYYFLSFHLFPYHVLYHPLVYKLHHFCVIVSLNVSQPITTIASYVLTFDFELGRGSTTFSFFVFSFCCTWIGLNFYYSWIFCIIF